MAFVYVEEIPSGLDLPNKMLIESAHAKMLLDFSTGYIYATNMTWNIPSHTAYTSKEQDLQFILRTERPNAARALRERKISHDKRFHQFTIGRPHSEKTGRTA